LRVGPDRWPTGEFARLALGLQQGLGAQMVLTGAESERRLVAPVAAALADPIELTGKTDLATLAAVTRQCDVFVCPDSGPMHVAAAAGVPVVGIYALEEDFPQRWAPFSDRSRIVRPADRGCRPGCVKATCPDFRCYGRVSLAEVMGAVESLI